VRSRNILALLGVALAVSPLAFAETANVNVYGTLNVSFESVKAVGVTNPVAKTYVNRFRLASNSSNIGFKVSEDISEGLKAFLQLESAVNPNSGDGVWNVRNSGIGLTGNFGTAVIGTWDTPFKLANMFMEPFYSTGVGFMATILDSTAGAVSSTFYNENPLSFTRRQKQSVQYWSPSVAGFTLKTMYSTNEKRDVDLDNPDLLGATLAYSEGPVNASFSYEQHDDFAGRSASALPFGGLTVKNTKDVGLKAAAGYKLFDSLSLGAAWSNLKYEATSGAGTAEYKKDSFVFTAMQKFDAWTLRAGWGKANDGTCKNADGSACTADSKFGATLLALGASYSMSKRTDVYGVYSKISNNEHGTYNFAVSKLDTVNAGADPTAVALGIRHTF